MNTEIPVIEPIPIKVYVQLDANNNLIGSPSSSLFLSDPTGWTLVDEGFGDKYAHAQGNYLPGPARTLEGIPRFHWDGEKVVERSTEEISAELDLRTPTPQIPTLEDRVTIAEQDIDTIAEAIMEVGIL